MLLLRPLIIVVVNIVEYLITLHHLFLHHIHVLNIQSGALFVLTHIRLRISFSGGQFGVRGAWIQICVIIDIV